MAILNITPDSFFDGGVNATETAWLQKVEQSVNDGAGIIDIGAVSTRPGASYVNEEEELKRLIPAVKSVVSHFPECIISIDTYRSGVAHAAIEEGAGMINDISGGTFDTEILNTVSRAGVPYILMHLKGDPLIMQKNPHYDNVTEEVMTFLNEQTQKALTAGVKQVIWDPGFGFDKTVEHNYQLMKDLKQFKKQGYPLLVGISRKSMINVVLGTKPAQALNGTTVLNTYALLNGADILRVHDVREAVQAVKILEMMM
ncbi:MAG: dihydropteroate synthase [Bacteroidota bacterium]|nr:dihydropteroate synthase [Bacteroidota bacterium]